VWYFADYISVGVLHIKHLAEEDAEVFRRTFPKFSFVSKEIIHKMGKGKQIVIVVSGVMNNFFINFNSIRHYRLRQVDLELLRTYLVNQ